MRFLERFWKVLERLERDSEGDRWIFSRVVLEIWQRSGGRFVEICVKFIRDWQIFCEDSGGNWGRFGEDLLNILGYV